MGTKGVYTRAFMGAGLAGAEGDRDLLVVLGVEEPKGKTPDAAAAGPCCGLKLKP